MPETLPADALPRAFAWATERSIEPLEIEGDWHWPPDQVPPCLWLEMQDLEPVTSRDQAFEKLARALFILHDAALIKADRHLTIDACIARLEEYADNVEPQNRRYYQTAAWLLRKMKND